ncbi:hypothetical protein HDU76_009809 [Blyttiomyces sp. JEL0837]|nr:hypothetical protein HDU76_009809 [Blyttiomyces sp. JEL0837]
MFGRGDAARRHALLNCVRSQQAVEMVLKSVVGEDGGVGVGEGSSSSAGRKAGSAGRDGEVGGEKDDNGDDKILGGDNEGEGGDSVDKKVVKKKKKKGGMGRGFKLRPLNSGAATGRIGVATAIGRGSQSHSISDLIGLGGDGGSSEHGQTESHGDGDQETVVISTAGSVVDDAE